MFWDFCAQLEVTIPRQGGGALVPMQDLKDTLLRLSLEEELGLCFIAALLFLDSFSLFVPALTF